MDKIALIDLLTQKTLENINTGGIHNCEVKLPLVGLRVYTNIQTKVTVNDECIVFNPIGNKIIIPCIFNPHTSQCLIVCGDMSFRIKYVVHNQYVDAEVLTVAYAEFFAAVQNQFSGGCRADQLIQKIRENVIPLITYEYNDIKEGAEFDIFADIRDVAVHDVNAIFAKPKMQLTTSIRPESIERTKKIDAYSLRHLAAHSEFWRGKGIAGVYPDRIMAQVYEDNINTYENIFLRMAVDKMYSLLHKETFSRALKKYSDSEIKALKETILNQQNDENAASLWGKWCVGSELFVSALQSEKSASEMQIETEQEHIISKALEIVSSVKESKLYFTLSRCADLPQPISLTNILTKDEHYNRVYRLWEEMQSLKAPELSDKTPEGTDNNIDIYYLHYISTLFAWSIKKAQGWREQKFDGVMYGDNQCISLDAEIAPLHVTFDTIANSPSIAHMKLTISCEETVNLSVPRKYHRLIDSIIKNCGNFLSYSEVEGNLSIRLPISQYKYNQIENNLLDTVGKDDQFGRKIMQIIDNGVAKSCTIGIVSSVMIPPKTEYDFKSWSGEMLSRLSEWANNMAYDNVLFVYPLAALDLDAIEYAGETRAATVTDQDNVQYAINYGNMYSDYSTATEYGNYKVAVLPVSRKEPLAPFRIIKYIEIQLARLQVEWGISDEICPVCGQHSVGRKINGDPYCRNEKCSAEWNMRICPKCHHKHPWIGATTKMKDRLSESQIINKEAVSPIKNVTNKEMLLDNSIITDYQYPNKYRCPICGYQE